jgi:O-antigen/teichoic acid export membrane protein
MATGDTLPASADANEPPAGRPTIAPLRRRLLSAGFWSLFGRAAAIGLLFATGMVLSRALSKGELAAYALATQASVFFAGVAALGTPQILSRTLRQLIYGPQPEYAGTVIRKCGRILAVGCAAGTAIFFAALPWLVDDGQKWELFRGFPWGIVAWSCLAAACLNSSFALQGLDDFPSATLVGSRRGGVLPNFAFLLFSLVLWQLGLVDGKTLVMGQIGFQVATLIFARIAIRRRLAALTAHRPAPVSGEEAPPLATNTMWYVKESLPYFLSMLVTLTIDELDVLWVGMLSDDVTTADYSVAKQLVRFMATPYVMFALSLAPFSAELLAKGQKERLERILRAGATLVSLPMIVIFAAFVFLPGPILAVVNGEKFRDAAPILQLLTLGQLVLVPLGFGSQVLLMAGRQRMLMYVSLAALVGYGALLPWAVGRWGANGAAAVQSASFIWQGIANAWLAKKEVGIWTPATWRPTDVRMAIHSLVGRRDHRQAATSNAVASGADGPPPLEPRPPENLAEV